MTFSEQVYALVARIPEGRVATYGQLAAMLGQPRGARPGGRAIFARRPGGRGCLPLDRVSAGHRPHGCHLAVFAKFYLIWPLRPPALWTADPMPI